MKKSIVIEPCDIKKMLAEKYGVEPKDVVKMQYSYVIMLKDGEEDEDSTVD